MFDLDTHEKEVNLAHNDIFQMIPTQCKINEQLLQKAINTEIQQENKSSFTCTITNNKLLFYNAKDTKTESTKYY